MNDGLWRARMILAEATNVGPEELDENASMATLEEWDSLAHMRIILAVEEFLGRQIAPETLIEIASVKDIAEIIGGDGEMTTQR